MQVRGVGFVCECGGRGGFCSLAAQDGGGPGAGTHTHRNTHRNVHANVAPTL